MRSSTCGQIEARCSAPAARRRGRRWARPSSAMSGTGTTTSRSHSLVDGGCTMSTGRPPARKRATSSTGRTVADSPIRCAGRRGGRRDARATAPGARRAWCRRRACTSSMMTVSTPARASRAAEVRMRNSDSGVVMSMSVGVRANARRSSAGVSPERTETVMSGSGSPSRVGGVPDADERAAQVALDVDGERLQGGDVQDPAAGLRSSGRGCDGEPVEGPEEGGEGLARAGRGDHEGVVAAADRRPGAVLRGRGRAEAAPEPRGGGGGEAVEDVVGHVGVSLSPTTDTAVAGFAVG